MPETLYFSDKQCTIIFQGNHVSLTTNSLKTRVNEFSRFILNSEIENLIVTCSNCPISANLTLHFLYLFLLRVLNRYDAQNRPFWYINYL